VLRGIDNAQGDAEVSLKGTFTTCVVADPILRIAPLDHVEQIIKAYETSTSTLRAVLADPALQRDRVDATMDALADALADQQEIDEAIQSGGQLAVAGSHAGAEVDEDELEKELQGLVDDKKREEGEVIEREMGKEREDRDRVQKEGKEKELEERLHRLRPTGEIPDSASREAIFDQEREEHVARKEAA